MTPTCAIVNFSSSPIDWMVSLILGRDPKACEIGSNLIWDIVTKYYTAKVQLLRATKEAILKKDLNGCDLSNCEAVIFYLDTSEKKSAWDDVKLAWDQLKAVEPGVCLLVVSTAEDGDQHQERISRTDLMEWTLTHQFELVECDEDQEEDEEEVGGIKECIGKDRIREALEAHTWSNLKLVGEDGKNLENDSEEASASVETPNKEIDMLDVEAEIDSLLQTQAQDGEDDQNFEALFSQFTSIRDKSANLDPEGRKAYAEKVAIAFWKAMGGSDDEIDGLDSD